MNPWLVDTVKTLNVTSQCGQLLQNGVRKNQLSLRTTSVWDLEAEVLDICS